MTENTALLTDAQRRYLLAFAREAVTAAVMRRQVTMPEVMDPMYLQPFGTFVTLKRQGELRGCIGYPEATYPLLESVRNSATNAALHDPRFPPVSPRELDDLELEISVLSPLRQSTPDEVTVGVHGLVIEQGYARGLLLPQVPTEWGWDREQFLAHTCRKAGLPADAWRSGARLYTFTAEVFSENDVSE
ncbi:MAG: AmmeMemoRadiSam system protein A [Armatimonadota bacterium]